MSDVDLGVRLGLALAEIKHSITSIEEEMELPASANETDAPYLLAHNRGLSYAYQRSADLIEEALNITSEVPA